MDCEHRTTFGADLMIYPSRADWILIATKLVNFRKGHDGLTALAEREPGLDPHSGMVIPPKISGVQK